MHEKPEPSAYIFRKYKRLNIYSNLLNSGVLGEYYAPVLAFGVKLSQYLPLASLFCLTRLLRFQTEGTFEPQLWLLATVIPELNIEI